MHDRIQRLAVGRENSMRKRGARWAAPRDGTDRQQVARLRTEQVSAEGSRSVIDQPQPFWKTNSKKKDKA